MPIVVAQDPQPPEESLSASVTVRLTATEKEALRATAKRLDTSMSALVRHLIQQGIK